MRSVTLIAVADIERDARTLNLALMLNEDGHDVTIVADGTLPDTYRLAGVRHHRVDLHQPRALQRMIAMRRAMSGITPTEVIHAMDLFALPAAARLARGVRESKSQGVRTSGSDTAHGPVDPGFRRDDEIEDRSPLTAHRAPLTAHRAPLTAHRAPLTAHRKPLPANRKPYTVLYDARELYSALGPLEGRGVRQRFITALEQWYVRRVVDHVTVSGPLDAEIIMQDLGLARRPTVILNVPPYRDVEPSDLLRTRCSIPPTSPVILYQGVVHHGRGLTPTLQALTHLPDAHLCILGEGPALQDTLTRADRLGVLGRVHAVSAVPYERLHEWTCSADVGTCCIEPVSRSYELALPNKMFEYIMARIPVVATDLPAMHAVLAGSELGVLVPRSLEPLVLAQAIRRAIAMRSTPEYRAAADSAAQVYCYEHQRDAVREAYA